MPMGCFTHTRKIQPTEGRNAPLLVSLLLLGLLGGARCPLATAQDNLVPLLALDFEGTLAGASGEVPLDAQNVGFDVAPDGFGARVGTDGTLQYELYRNITPVSGMVDVWLQRKWDSSFLSHFIFSAGDQYTNLVELNKDQNHYLRFLTSRDGDTTNISYLISGWAMDSWHHIRAVWNHTGMFLYVDGDLVGSNNDGGSFRPPSTLDAPIYIGSHSEVPQTWSDWVIDSLTVYGLDLGPEAQTGVEHWELLE
jgi:hypothetical protein